jgi:hypothetical protein
MKRQIISIRIAGVISLIFMLFHFAFNRLFNWENTLSCLSQDNRSIMITYHFISILIIGFMAYISLFRAKVLLNSPLKISILGFFVLFYLIRIIAEFTQFGFSFPQSLLILIMCAIPVVCYTILIFYKPKSSNIV